MISPNFAPIDPASRWIMRPGGPLLLRTMVGFDAVGDPSNHVLAGDILSPADTDEVFAPIADFIRDSATAY